MSTVSPLSRSLKLPPPGSIRNVTFGEILSHFGLEQALFYVVDSHDLSFTRSMMRPCKTNDFSVLYVDSGSLTVRHGLQEFEVEAGAMLFKPAGTVTQMRGFSKDCRVRVFGFTRDLVALSGVHKKHLEALAFLSMRTTPLLRLQEQEAAAIRQVLDILQAKSVLREKPAFYNESVGHVFALFIYEVAAALHRDHANELTVINRRDHLTYSFMKLVADHVMRERSVQFYAGLLNVTPKYLSKCVKEVIGKTCSEIIDEMVILEAKVLLDDPELTVAQVADRLHFPNPFFFSRYFKSQTTLSPRAYRISA